MPKKVLVIDDDPGVHVLVAALLTKQGYAVVAAHNGEQGLQLALSEKPQMILLDVIMPGIKGRELCVKIKSYEVLKNIPVVFLTAKDSPDDLQAQMDVGGLTHLTKPVDPEYFVSVVNSILG